MLIKMNTPEVNGAFNSSFLFHSVKIKSSLNITGIIENDINNIDNKIIITNYVCGAQLIDGKISYLDFDFIKANNLDYYNNLVNIYSKLLNINLSGIATYGNMIVSYDTKFYVSGISPIENIRNVVYNLICVSILDDYKQRK